jgi:hypothetical protein
MLAVIIFKMRFGFTIISLLTILTTGTAQKTDLDFINADKFEPEGKMRGIGMVTVNSMDTTHYKNDLVIYDSHGKPKIIIRITEDDVTTKIGSKTYHYNERLPQFDPREYTPHPDYFVLIFDCIKTTDHYYQVTINQKTKENGFIKKSDNKFIFETFEQYINDWASTAFDFDRSKNPLRTEPSDNSRIVLNENLDKYKIWRVEKIELKGEWLKVKTLDKEEGWIRWKSGNKIIIKLYFVC